MTAFLIIVLAAGLIMLAVVSVPQGRHQTSGKDRGSNRTGRLDRDFVAGRWAAIQGQAALGGNGLRQAVSEADKLLDYALIHCGVPGQTMGDRLKVSGKRFSDINAIWRAHKLRNTMAHEVGHDLVASQAHEALRDFERGLRDLGAL